jgi:hypothetical protein
MMVAIAQGRSSAWHGWRDGAPDGPARFEPVDGRLVHAQLFRSCATFRSVACSDDGLGAAAA